MNTMELLQPEWHIKTPRWCLGIIKTACSFGSVNHFKQEQRLMLECQRGSEMTSATGVRKTIPAGARRLKSCCACSVCTSILFSILCSVQNEPSSAVMSQLQLDKENTALWADWLAYFVWSGGDIFYSGRRANTTAILNEKQRRTRSTGVSTGISSRDVSDNNKNNLNHTRKMWSGLYKIKKATLTCRHN